MLEVLRAEFPGATGWVARLRRPTITSEPVAWAFFSALGAGFIVEGIVRIALMPIYPMVFPATEPHPGWLTPAAIGDVAAGVATGAVALRAGGIATVGAYVAYKLLTLIAALPGRTIFCARSGGAPPDLPTVVGCDYLSLLYEQWPIWIALAFGVVSARLFQSRAGDGNRLLRGAGAFVLIGSVSGSALGLLVTLTVTATGGNPNTTLLTVLFLLINTVAAMAAGALLARSRLAGAVLVTLLIAGPTLAFTLPSAVREGFSTEPLEFTFTRWQGVVFPIVTAAALLATRAYLRAKGTFS
jgi:hypothetical protein